MSINTKKIGAISRTDLVWFDPDVLEVVTDLSHPLFDERANWVVKEEFVSNIKTYGVLEPVIARFNPSTGKTEVIDGRQRTKACRIAKAAQVAAGEIPIRVPVVLRKEADSSVMGVMVSANEIRQADAVLVKAKKAKRMLDLGQSKKEIATAFGVTTQTIDNWVGTLSGEKKEQKPSNLKKAVVQAKLKELGEPVTDFDKGFKKALEWLLEK